MMREPGKLLFGHGVCAKNLNFYVGISIKRRRRLVKRVDDGGNTPSMMDWAGMSLAPFILITTNPKRLWEPTSLTTLSSRSMRIEPKSPEKTHNWDRPRLRHLRRCQPVKTILILSALARPFVPSKASERAPDTAESKTDLGHIHVWRRSAPLSTNP